MKSALQKRLEEIETMAANRHPRIFRALCKKMTTAELRECIDDNTTEDRIQEIVKGAADR